MDFESLLLDYNLNDIDINQFLLNALIAAALAGLTSLYYKKYGNSVSNRSQFANNFILLTLTTMLIITIVKSSIALSLGLVGALSIVRFRAAIKEPEELVYLFLVIAIGLGMGAGQPAITILAFVLIAIVLNISRLVNKQNGRMGNNQMQLTISTDTLAVEQINNILTEHLKVADLRRMSESKGKLYLSYVIHSTDMNELLKIKEGLLGLSPSMEVSFIDNSNIAG